MKLVSLLFKHVVGNQASIAAYPIPAASPERHSHRVLKWVLRGHLLGNNVQEDESIVNNLITAYEACESPLLKTCRW